MNDLERRVEMLEARIKRLEEKQNMIYERQAKLNLNDVLLVLVTLATCTVAGGVLYSLFR